MRYLVLAIALMLPFLATPKDGHSVHKQASFDGNRLVGKTIDRTITTKKGKPVTNDVVTVSRSFPVMFIHRRASQPQKRRGSE